MLVQDSVFQQHKKQFSVSAKEKPEHTNRQTNVSRESCSEFEIALFWGTEGTWVVVGGWVEGRRLIGTFC